MTKAQRILDLYIGAVGTMPERELPRFVAAQIDTTASYVRTVARQRLGCGTSEADRRYNGSPLGRKRHVRYRAKRRAEARAS